MVPLRNMIHFMLPIVAANAKSNLNWGFDALPSSDYKPPIEAVQLYLHSIGYSVEDLCLSEQYSSTRGLEEDLNNEDKGHFFFIKNGLLALACVIVAALAAGVSSSVNLSHVFEYNSNTHRLEFNLLMHPFFICSSQWD